MSAAILTISTSDNLYRREVVIVSYSRGYSATMNQSTVRSREHHYPIQVRENDFQFSIQCRSVEEFEILVDLLSKSQESAYTEPNKGTVQIAIPDLGIDYIGYVSTLGAGVRRFEVAPNLPVVLTLIKDNINISSLFTHSTFTGDWDDVLGTSEFDLYNQRYVDRLYDSALKSKPPAGGGGRRMLIV
jgi:hypothetical protein